MEGKKRVGRNRVVDIHTYTRTYIHRYIYKYGRSSYTLVVAYIHRNICGNVERGWSAIARRLIWFNGEFIWVDAPPFNQQDCLRPPTDTATDYRVGPRCASPRKIIPVNLYPPRAPFPSIHPWYAFATFSRKRFSFPRPSETDECLWLLVGELSKPRRRLLPPANPELVRSILSLFPPFSPCYPFSFAALAFHRASTVVNRRRISFRRWTRRSSCHLKRGRFTRLISRDSQGLVSNACE